MPKARYIKSGSATVRIFISRSGKYQRHELRWTDHTGRPHRLKKSNLSKALAEARRIADDLATGQPAAALSLSDLASFRAAIQNLFGTGRTLETATAEYADTLRILAAAHLPLVPLTELATSYVKHHASRTTPLATGPLSKSVDHFLATKRSQGISTAWHDKLRLYLTHFAAAHPGLDIECLTAPMIRDWCLHLPKLNGRTRNNHLAAVQALFTQPELRHHPERDAIAALQPCIEPPSENQLWTPQEFRRLLNTALLPQHAHCLPLLVLAGFCMIRMSEIRRIHRETLDLDHARLKLRAGQTKTARTRIIALPPCAVAWLRLTGKQPGPLWPWGTTKQSKDLRALARACGLTWRHNALRNSAVTYDQMRAPDLKRVARQAGNSPTILESSYLALDADTATMPAAKAWFTIFPPRPATATRRRVIVPLPAQNR